MGNTQTSSGPRGRERSPASWSIQAAVTGDDRPGLVLEAYKPHSSGGQEVQMRTPAESVSGQSPLLGSQTPPSHRVLT